MLVTPSKKPDKAEHAWTPEKVSAAPAVATDRELQSTRPHRLTSDPAEDANQLLKLRIWPKPNVDTNCLPWLKGPTKASPALRHVGKNIDAIKFVREPRNTPHCVTAVATTSCYAESSLLSLPEPQIRLLAVHVLWCKTLCSVVL